jgi:SNF2 family DNA or RNA helicase
MIYDSLHPYQRKVVDYFSKGVRIEHALIADTGVGKTWIAAGVIEKLIDFYHMGPLFLVIAQKSNLESTWAKTLGRVAELDVCLSWPEFKSAKGRGPKVLVLSYGMVPSLITKLVRVEWALVIYDEGHKLKDRQSKTSRDAAKLRGAENRLILTGTPIEKRPIDLFGQFRFCTPHLFGKWGDFAKMYCRKGGYMGHEWEFRWQRLPRFKRTITPYIYRLRKREALALPPLRIVNVKVPLLGQQRRLYDALETEMVASHNGSDITSQLTVTNLIRLQQIAGGFVRTDKVLSWRKTKQGIRVPTYELLTTGGNAKLRKTLAILQRAEPPVVIFCHFLEELRVLRAAVTALPGNKLVAELHGATHHRAEIVSQFQRGNLDILLCQMRTGGVGIDLFAAHTGIIYSCDWSSIANEQAIARLHRHGQKDPVTIYWLQADRTIDEDIRASIRTKQTTIKSILSGIRNRHNEAPKL